MEATIVFVHVEGWFADILDFLLLLFNKNGVISNSISRS